MGSGSFCTSTQFNVTVDSAALATISGACFRELPRFCWLVALVALLTWVGTNFPWRATAVTTTNIHIDGIDIDISFEQTPGTLDECVNQGLNIRLTGTVTASFTPNATATARRFDFNGGPAGFVSHISLVPRTFVTAVVGQVTPTGLLNVLD